MLSSSVSSSEEKGVLSKIIDMIHDEFAFDGYLDDGVEDVNMGKNHTSPFSSALYAIYGWSCGSVLNKKKIILYFSSTFLAEALKC